MKALHYSVDSRKTKQHSPANPAGLCNSTSIRVSAKKPELYRRCRVHWAFVILCVPRISALKKLISSSCYSLFPLVALKYQPDFLPLIINREVMPGRTTMIIVKENFGF
jgi:hypothetical protein